MCYLVLSALLRVLYLILLWVVLCPICKKRNKNRSKSRLAIFFSGFHRVTIWPTSDKTCENQTELPSGNLIRGGRMPLMLPFLFSPAFAMNVMSRAVAAILWLESESQDGKGGRAERERVWVCKESLNYWTISVTAYCRFLLYFWDSSVLFKSLLLFIVYVLFM